VQTPTLYMIYQLKEKNRNCQKETYCEEKAQVIPQNGAFKAKLEPNETQATQEAFEDYLKEKGVQLGKQPGTIHQVETEKKSAASPRLFSLSSLQSKMNQLMKASA
ncbi:DNA topoisomerase, partial [Enterococcus faecium]